MIEADEAIFRGNLDTRDGQTHRPGASEVPSVVGVLRYYAEHGAEMLADEPVRGTAAKKGAYLKYQPIGPVLAVMPWNFPLWQVIRFATPTFMVGNVACLSTRPTCPKRR